MEKNIHNKDIESKVMSIIGRVCKKEISLDKSLQQDLNLDDLDFLEVIWNLEREFEIQIPDTALEHSRWEHSTVRDLALAVERKIGA